jgi:hypothetical protein
MSMSMYVSTDPDPIFLLDPEVLPRSLSLSNGGLTVKNNASKKWSTARTLTKFTSGVHKWEVGDPLSLTHSLTHSHMMRI